MQVEFRDKPVLEQALGTIYASLGVDVHDILVEITPYGSQYIVEAIDLMDKTYRATVTDKLYEALVDMLPFCDQGHEPLLHGGHAVIIYDKKRVGEIFDPSGLKTVLSQVTQA